MMYPLVIASIAVVAIFIERFNYYKKCRSDTQLITGMLREYIPGGKFDELADALAKDGGIPASVILDGVKCTVSIDGSSWNRYWHGRIF